jgi:hypothetical protein
LNEEVIVIMMALIIVTGAGLMMAAMRNRRRMREMVHRERLAMIERGLIPAPESDPGGFEVAAGFKTPGESTAAVRFRTAGIILIGIGVGMMFLITFTAGEAEVGFGVGGAWVALGGALLLNYFLMTRGQQDDDMGMPRRWAPPAAAPRNDPPSNTAP